MVLPHSWCFIVYRVFISWSVVRKKTGPSWVLLSPVFRVVRERTGPYFGCSSLTRFPLRTRERGKAPLGCYSLRRLADRQRAAAHYDPENSGLFPRGVWLLLAIERGPPGTTDPRRPHRVAPPSSLYLWRLSYLPAHQEVSAPVASVSFPQDLRSPKPDPPSTKVCSAEPHHLSRALVESPLLALPTLQELSGRGAPTDQSPGHPAIPSVIQPIFDSTSREDSSSSVVTSPSRAPLH